MYLMGNEERLEESGLNELTEEQCRVPGQFLDQVAAVNMADIAGRVRKMQGMSGYLPPCVGDYRWEDLSLTWKEIHIVMMEGSKEKVGEFGPWNVVESTWEEMTIRMLLLRDGWEQEWRFVDDVPDDGQEPVC